MDDVMRKRLMIGRLSFLMASPRPLGEAAMVRGDSYLFLYPALPDESLHDAVATIRGEDLRGGTLVTARACGGPGALGLVWLEVELIRSGTGHEGPYLPTMPATTVKDILRLTRPGASWTIQLGSERLKVRLWPETEPITDPEAVELLSDLIPA